MAVLLVRETKGREQPEASGYHALNHRELKKLARDNPDQIVAYRREMKLLNHELKHLGKKAKEHRHNAFRMKAALKPLRRLEAAAAVAIPAVLIEVATTDWGQNLMQKVLHNGFTATATIAGILAASARGLRVVLPIYKALRDGYKSEKTEKQIKKLERERHELRVHLDPRTEQDKGVDQVINEARKDARKTFKALRRAERRKAREALKVQHDAVQEARTEVVAGSYY